MNNKFKNFVFFSSGAIAGSLITWKIIKGYYERLSQEEIDSVKESFSRKESLAVDKSNAVQDEKKETKFDNLLRPSDGLVIKKNDHYTPYGDMYGSKSLETDENEEAEEKINAPNTTPLIISPDDFGIIDEYDTVSLTCFSDGVIVEDETNNVLSEPEIIDTLGPNVRNHFGEYENDTVYVQNDERTCYYELMADTKTYQEFIDMYPECRKG